MTTKHSPTPWDVYARQIVRASPSSWVAECRVALSPNSSPRIDQLQSEANAAFIVQACNAHETLVAALKAAEQRILEVSVVNNVPGIQSQAVLRQIRAALALVENEATNA